MNWKDYCKGFAIQKHPCDWEQKSLIMASCLEQIPYRMYSNPKDVPLDFVPTGNIPWISKIIGKTITPNYYPDFLKSWVKRKVWYSEKWPLERVFIKPADKHKRFNGFITTGRYNGKKRGPFWCSEVIKFIDEWRYYISYGKVIGGYWYWGIGDTPKESPKLNITYPNNWCGTADFGMLEDGSIQLIESHHPFSCGWYGKKNEEYAEFVVMGWKWLNENYCINNRVDEVKGG